jgi:hypothetical protein
MILIIYSSEGTKRCSAQTDVAVPGRLHSANLGIAFIASAGETPNTVTTGYCVRAYITNNIIARMMAAVQAEARINNDRAQNSLVIVFIALASECVHIMCHHSHVVYR